MFRPGLLSGLLHAERLADVGQVVGAVDIADEVELVDLTHLLAVNVGRPVADGVLAGAVGGRGGGDGAALVTLGNDHKNVLDGADATLPATTSSSCCATRRSMV